MILNIVLCVFLVTYCLHISYLISFYNIYGYLVSGVSLLFEHLPNIVGPLLLKWGRTIQKLDHFLGGGVPKILLKSRDNPEKSWLPLFCYFTIQLHLLSVCVGGGSKVCFYYILILQSFELAMQDSHPSLYSTKTLYHLYISDSF